MSTPTFLPTLAAIAAQVQVLDDCTYRLRGQDFSVAYQQAYTHWAQPLHHFGQNNGDDHQRRTNLQQQLTQALYGTYYCAGSTAPGPAAPVAPLPSAAERAQSMARLSAANSTPEGTDPQWVVYAVDAQGNVFAHKNDLVRQLQPNQWEFANPQETSVQVGTVVRIRMHREDTNAQPVFYYVHSAALLPQQAELVRLYFHTTFAGAEVLVRELTRVFNQYQLPFLFKCLNHPDLFTRTDSAVLYLSKFDVRLASRLLRPVLASLAPHLRAEVPLFTRQLRPGVSFSEDPGNGQSFGMHRCGLLAEALVSAGHQQLTTDEGRLAEMGRLLDRHGLDVAHLYRNPNSHLHYPFAALAGAPAPVLSHD